MLEKLVICNSASSAECVSAEAFTFFLAYIFLVLFGVYVLISNWWQKKKSVPVWVYGVCNGRKARRDKKSGRVQFIMWKAGEQGHKKDCWLDFDSTWWSQFRESK